MPVLEFHFEHGIWQRFNYSTFYGNSFFFFHKFLVAIDQSWLRITPPCSATVIVCSKCAESLPSAVITVQLSCRICTSEVPIFTMGSSAKTIPARKRGPRLGGPKLGTCGSSCKAVPIPWPTKTFTTEYLRCSAKTWIAWEISDR